MLRMEDMRRTAIRQQRPGPGPAADTDRDPDLAGLLALVARGDHAAFELLYGQLAGPVYGVVRQVLRDPAQSEEIAQEVLLEIWRTATRFDPAKGSPAAWVLTIAHRRAVNRVRSETASLRREEKAAADRGTPGRRRGRGGGRHAGRLLGVALGTVKTRIRDGLNPGCVTAWR